MKLSFKTSSLFINSEKTEALNITQFKIMNPVKPKCELSWEKYKMYHRYKVPRLNIH